MLSFIALGTVLGLSAGFAPGPLLTLVISETLQHDVRSGIRIAVAPIITDLPIIGITYYFASHLSQFHQVLGIISLIGGCLLLYMGYQGIKSHGVDLDLKSQRTGSLRKGILVNALSPHPYLFWLSIGAAIIAQALEVNTATAIIFLLCFYLLLVGSKVLLAIMVSKSKSFLTSSSYRYIMHGLGIALILLALNLFHDGLELLQLI